MADTLPFDGDLERAAPAAITVNGLEIRRGSRVRLCPRAGADGLDMALAGRVAVVAAIEQDYEERVHVAVTLDDDPGRALGSAAQLGHRFFFAPDELEPLAAASRVLVAGIGNVFLGDDAFGVEVARRLLARPPADGVTVVDFGIRGLDLAYALQDGWDALVLVDAAPLGEAPGTLSVVEPALEETDDEHAPDAHGLDPVRVLRLARRLGGVPPRVRLVACEPASLAPPDDEPSITALSAPVAAAVEAAVALVEQVVNELKHKESAP